jgi:hypothetical protein
LPRSYTHQQENDVGLEVKNAVIFLQNQRQRKISTSQSYVPNVATVLESIALFFLQIPFDPKEAKIEITV